jgi:signal peptidase II
MCYIFVRIPSGSYMLPIRVLIPVVTAGAIGNFIDRLMFGYVRDFLYFSLINFPIFNVADIYVTCSVFVLAYLILFHYKEEDLDFLGH